MLDHDPRSAEAWHGLGLAAYRSQRFDEAEKALRRALTLKTDNADIRHHLAATLRSAGQAEAAIPFYEEAAKGAPDNAGLLNNWGNALVDIGRYEDGIRVFRRAITANPAAGLLCTVSTWRRRF